MISSRLPASLIAAVALVLSGAALARVGAPAPSEAAAAGTRPAGAFSVAQSDARTDAPAAQTAPKNVQKSEQRVEQIRHEDAGSRIDELRVGGETRTITVQPKNSQIPAYEITPPSNNVNPSNTDHNNQGGSRWKVLSY